MSRFFYTLILFLFIRSQAGFSQNIIRCGDTEYLQYVQLNFPGEYSSITAAHELSDQWVAENGDSYERTVVTIPVVVHVVYNNTAQNLSDAQINSQIDALNRDFRKQNTDWSQTPATWQSLVADCELEFCLAERDPDGNATNGITRTSTSTTIFNLNDNMKETSSGGEDGWDNDRYLNIWVCNLVSGILGYATFPGGADWKDGVVIDYQAFGTTGSLFSGFTNGRTTVHEIGHYFGLFHIWGDDGDGNTSNNSTSAFCSGADYVSDTPNQSEETYGCPSGNIMDGCATIAPGKMWMNYMDYSDDDCLYMFTNGQKIKMTAVLNTTRSLLKTSFGCFGVGIFDPAAIEDLAVYPNPSGGIVDVTLPNSVSGGTELEVYNSIGQLIFRSSPFINYESKIEIDLTNEMNGFYFIKLITEEKSYGSKVIINH